jgi:hypothetical protein
MNHGMLISTVTMFMSRLILFKYLSEDILFFFSYNKSYKYVWKSV